MANKLKPRITEINLDRFNPVSLEYYCYSSEIDQKVYDLKEFKGPRVELRKTHVFVVTSDLRIDVVPAEKFALWMAKHKLADFTESEPSNKAKIAIDYFIKEVHGIKPKKP